MANISTSVTQGNKPSPTHDDVSVDVIPRSVPQNRCVLHKVPSQMCKTGDDDHIYKPVVVSLGPYHHGGTHLPSNVEEFKDEALNMMLNSKDKDLILHKITERIHEIRNFYGSLPMQEYDNEDLAKIMFRDSCFVLYYMECCLDYGDNNIKYDLIIHRLRFSAAAFMFRDFFMLENPVPLWLIKMLFSLIHKDDEEGDDDREWEGFICKFLSLMKFGDFYRMKRVPWGGREHEPLHILDAQRTTFLEGENIISRPHRILGFLGRKMRRNSRRIMFQIVDCSQSLSVTELKNNHGIRFGPSSNCLKDIRFHSNLFYGKLQLPILFVTNNSKILLSNLIAFEMSMFPEMATDFSVTSYINFMKSLIEGPEDVKELRDKEILISLLPNDEVVRVFKQMETYGFDDYKGIFRDVKREIEEHCDSMSKTWTAELIRKYFGNPWTAIGVLAATFLLCLTFLQTYYTINPLKKD